MSVNIRYPNITSLSEKEQIEQIKSYLIQLVDQLNYALATIGSGGAETANATQSSDQSYTALESFLAQEFKKIYSLLDHLESRDAPVAGVDYFTEEDKEQIINEVLAALKEE